MTTLIVFRRKTFLRDDILETRARSTNFSNSTHQVYMNIRISKYRPIACVFKAGINIKFNSM